MSSEQDKYRTQLLTRRDAILRVSAMLGGMALVGQTAMLSGCTAPASHKRELSGDDITLLDEVADTILPETGTPGAKAAGVGPFIALMVADTYDDREQEIFAAGLVTLEQECLRMHGKYFLPSTPPERLALLEELDAEQYRYMNGRSRREPAHWFRMIKELTLLGYFTSEIGYRQAMRYIESPGRYDPCVPYSPGDKAWAQHA